jgi:hypothetical protein
MFPLAAPPDRSSSTRADETPADDLDAIVASVLRAAA